MKKTKSQSTTESRIGAISRELNSEALQELNSKLRKKRLSASEAFQLPRTIRTLVRQDALQMEQQGDEQGIIDLYTHVSDGLKSLAPKAPSIYQPLINSSAKYWESEAKEKLSQLTKQVQYEPKSDYTSSARSTGFNASVAKSLSTERRHRFPSSIVGPSRRRRTQSPVLSRHLRSLSEKFLMPSTEQKMITKKGAGKIETNLELSYTD